MGPAMEILRADGSLSSSSLDMFTESHSTVSRNWLVMELNTSSDDIVTYKVTDSAKMFAKPAIKSPVFVMKM